MELDTERLRLRPLEKDDAAMLHALWTDPDVRRYLWDDRVIPRALADEVVASSLSGWQTHGYGQWVVSLRKGGEPVGFCGLRPSSWCEAPELLFGFWPVHWSQGLATEAALVVLDDAFDRVGLDQVVAATDAPNTASARVLARIGMVEERRGTLNGLDSIFFTASRPSADRERVARSRRKSNG